MLLRKLNFRKARRGAALVEMACILIVFIPLLMGAVFGGLGAFRYNQINHLAGEAARWASVRGETYQQEQNQPAPTNESVRQFIQQHMPGLVPDDLAVELSMDSGQATVTLRYRWVSKSPIGTIDFESTASTPITY